MATPNVDLDNGDVPTQVGDHATPAGKTDGDNLDDSIHPLQVKINQALKYLSDEIATQNSLTYVEPAADKVMPVQQQIAVRKEIVIIARNIKTHLESIVK